MTLREPQRPRPRIESLTDLIFGLALSIGALVLLNKPSDLDQLLLSIGLFGFSFLILISIWLRYTETMSVLPIETSGTRTLNVLLLFLVALEPYLFNLIGQARPSTATSRPPRRQLTSARSLLSSPRSTTSSHQKDVSSSNRISFRNTGSSETYKLEWHSSLASPSFHNSTLLQSRSEPVYFPYAT